ncbi:protein indeterminate-domain 12 [Prunus yedoensis var. nudiflora]|uniref:Protein indeterminate-domain 12 n=1 Tax=Prunus yedoensis var. nudiflora TaxID=2094558 RepID=A0A314UTF8_PRUYE|nr:protein indeterminate-domain 12 [Prunus yedoensis var. nudiflora]
MFPAMSNSTSLSEEANSLSSDFGPLNPLLLSTNISPHQSDQHHQHPTNKIKKKRSLPGNPDPDAEVIALSPKTLLATNRFVCEICNKGFQRDQNLQLHRRGHNLPWKLKQRNNKDQIRKRAYVCPEPSCVHHHPSRALGDLTGIKKHFCRKHGEKKWKCDKCSKIYAVQSDWKAHSKTCGTREYRCDCGTLFSRKDSFITHRAFCDALAEESAKLSASQLAAATTTTNPNIMTPQISLFPFPNSPPPFTTISLTPGTHLIIKTLTLTLITISSRLNLITTTISQQHNPTRAATVGSSSSAAASAGQQAQSAGLTVGEFGTASHMNMISTDYLGGFTSGDLTTWQTTDRLTRDFLGLTGDGTGNHNVGAVNVVKDMLTYAGGVEFQQQQQHPYDQPLRGHNNSLLLKPQGFGFAETTAAASETWGDC